MRKILKLFKKEWKKNWAMNSKKTLLKISKTIFDNLTENKLVQIIKYNKNIQFKLNKDINDYIKNYKKVIIKY